MVVPVDPAMKSETEESEREKIINQITTEVAAKSDEELVELLFEMLDANSVAIRSGRKEQ